MAISGFLFDGREVLQSLDYDGRIVTQECGRLEGGIGPSKGNPFCQFIRSKPSWPYEIVIVRNAFGSYGPNVTKLRKFPFTAPFFSVREFGNCCFLISLGKLIDYADTLNLVQADETNRSVERKDVPLLEPKAFFEATLNAVLHNK